MRRAALTALGLLATAAPALANVNSGALKPGTYKGTTAQRESVKFKFGASALHRLHLGYAMSCTSGHTIGSASKPIITNIPQLGPIAGKHAAFKAGHHGVFTFPNGARGHYKLTESIAVHFPNDHMVAGTFSATETISNQAGLTVDTCSLRRETWSATRR
jgi:hypothetical protein